VASWLEEATIQSQVAQLYEWEQTMEEQSGVSNVESEAMYIFELTYPGTWLEHQDQAVASAIQRLLGLLEDQLTEAAVALNLFEQACARPPRPPFDEEAWRKDGERRRELEEGYLQKARSSEPNWPTWQEREEARQVADVALKREKWTTGTWPWEYEHKLSFLYAKAFLHSVDAISKLLGVLSKEHGLTADVAKYHQRFKASFPDLKGVRDSEQHREDRGRGLDRKGNPLNLKPIDNNMISAPGGGVLALGNLNGNRYGNTLDDGSYGEVEVSPASLREAQVCIQGIIDELAWNGPKRHYPS
jgi:hypothetical protein